MATFTTRATEFDTIHIHQVKRKDIPSGVVERDGSYDLKIGELTIYLYLENEDHLKEGGQ